MKLKSIIVDDEKHGRENLAGILRSYCLEVELAGEAASEDEVQSPIGEQMSYLNIPTVRVKISIFISGSKAASTCTLPKRLCN